MQQTHHSVAQVSGVDRSMSVRGLESMRLYPPAYGIGREAARPTEVAGCPMLAGEIVIAPTWVVHRDGRWFDEPATFRPERWANDATLRLLSFRRRTAAVHRQYVRDDGG